MIREKFCNSEFEEEEAVKISNFIKHKGKLLQQLEMNEKINHDNIKILIDELLQYEEDKEEGIEFVIDYEKILLDKGIK